MEPLLERWKVVIRKAIQKDADIHRFSEDNHSSILQELMILVNCPFEAQDMIDLWLDLLSFSGVDLASYLKIEMNYHREHKSSLKDLEGRQRRMIFQPGFWPPLSWDWWINPRGPVHEVLQEFQHFGLPVDCPYETGWSPIYREMGDNWPFVYPTWWFKQCYDWPYPPPANARGGLRAGNKGRQRSMPKRRDSIGRYHDCLGLGSINNLW